MALEEETLTREDIEAMLSTWEDGDAEAAAEFWAEDGEFIDPQYPETFYEGRDQVQEGLAWALENPLDIPKVIVRRVWQDGEDFAVEVDTRHTMEDGSQVDYPQAFIVEGENGKIKRWQTYTPFSPDYGD